MAGIDIQSINKAGRLALTNHGEAPRIATYRDSDGDETDDPQAAVVAIGEWPDGRWFSVALTAFEAVRMH